MKIKESASRKVFNVFNYIILSIVTFAAVLPILHVLALSLSSSTAAAAGKVGLIPTDFSIEAYTYLMGKPDFFRSVGIAVLRVLVGASLNMIMIVLTAYPLSKTSSVFRLGNTEEVLDSG